METQGSGPQYKSELMNLYRKEQNAMNIKVILCDMKGNLKYKSLPMVF